MGWNSTWNTFIYAFHVVDAARTQKRYGTDRVQHFPSFSALTAAARRLFELPTTTDYWAIYQNGGKSDM